MKIKTPEEQQLEQERLAEILIVLEELFQREGATGKRVIGCLYDIAVINWVNRHVPLPFNPLLKYLAKYPRGLAQYLGLKLYLQPKCPKLITDWLYTLVEFPPPATAREPRRTTATVELPREEEVHKLKQQVRLLTGSLIITIVLSLGSMTLLWQRDRFQNFPFLQGKHPPTVENPLDSSPRSCPPSNNQGGDFAPECL